MYPLNHVTCFHVGRVTRFDGLTVQGFGDGVTSPFDRSVDAVFQRSSTLFCSPLHTALRRKTPSHRISAKTARVIIRLIGIQCKLLVSISLPPLYLPLFLPPIPPSPLLLPHPPPLTPQPHNHPPRNLPHPLEKLRQLLQPPYLLCKPRHTALDLRFANRWREERLVDMQGAWVDMGAIDAVDEGLAVRGGRSAFLGFYCFVMVYVVLFLFLGEGWWEEGLWCLCCLGV